MSCLNWIYEKIKEYPSFACFIFATFVLFIFLLNLTVRYYIYSNEYIWFNSKILSIRNITDTLYLNYTIYHYLIDRWTYTSINYSYYELLENATKGDCKEGLKQCGILDTIGNKLCLPEQYDCPINDILIDLKENNNSHNGYNTCHYDVLPYTTVYDVYFTNNKTNGSIVASILNTTNIPGFIGNHCFVFDIKSFEDRFNYQIYDLNEKEKENNKIIKEAIGGEPNSSYKNFEAFERYTYTNSWYNISATKIAITKEEELGEFLNEKFVKAKNRDKYYKKISDGVYVKNFVGFENREQLDLFKNTDFTIYKSLFPDNIRIYPIIFSEVLLALSIYIFYVWDKKYINIYNFFMSCFFVFIFIYICCSYNANKKDYSYLKEINSDDNIKDFINEFLDIIKYRKIFFVISLVFLIISAIFYILSYVFYFIYIFKKNEYVLYEN